MQNVTATRWIFFLQPLVLGAWFARIPQVQATAELSAGQLAFALIGMPIGLLLALFFGGRVSEALGTRRLLFAAFIAQVFLMPLPAFATSGVTLFVSLLVAGVSLALAELGLNVTASEVEKRSDKPIMNGCHGFWSVGVMVGSAIGATCAAWGIAPGLSLVAVALISLGPALRFSNQITDFDVKAPPQEGPKVRGISAPLAAISLFTFGVAMTEGAMADWSAVYLTEAFAAPPGLAGASYTMFALFVAAGRFSGDALKARIPVERLARIFALIALAGLAITVLTPWVWLTFLGVAMLGAGVSLGFPLAVSAASVLPGRSSAGNVAILTQMSLCGFLIGPPMIGMIAEATTMRGGLMALAPPLVMAMIFASALRSRG